MNWEAIGAVGEVAGAVVVVATLFYLSQQIRQNAHALERSNEYAKTASINASNGAYARVFAQLAQDAELAAIYQRALAGESLDPAESVRFAAFANTYFAWLEGLYSQVESALAFEGMDSPRDLIEVSQPYFARLLGAEAGRAWWEADAPHQYSPEFLAEVNEAMGWAQSS